MKDELLDICRGPMPYHGGARLVGGRTRIIQEQKSSNISKDSLEKSAAKFPMKNQLIESVLKNLGLIAIAIALFVVALAIWNHQRYVVCGDRAYIDSRTGELYPLDGKRLGM